MIVRRCLRVCCRFFARLISDMGAAAVPAQCPSCLGRVELKGRLCSRCARSLSAERGGRRLRWKTREKGASSFRTIRGTAAGELKGVWGRLIRAYKEDPDRQTAALVEPVWVGLVAARAERDAGAGVVLVPVPMAPVRRRQRGFNPPDRLAAMAAGITGRPAVYGALRRVRYRGPLRGKGAKQRRAEMEDAFGPGPEAARIFGSRVVLIDDVATTGATLGAAAVTLRAMGARGSIRVWVLGRTPRPVEDSSTRHEPGPDPGVRHRTSGGRPRGEMRKRDVS